MVCHNRQFKKVGVVCHNRQFKKVGITSMMSTPPRRSYYPSPLSGAFHHVI